MSADVPHDWRAVQDFTEAVREGASGYMVAACKGYRRGQDRDGRSVLDTNFITFRWDRCTYLSDVVTNCAWHVVQQADAWAHARRFGLDEGVYFGLSAEAWTEGETLIRLATFDDVPTDANGRPRGGKGDECASVLGLHLDLDVLERRPRDPRAYCPTIGHAVMFWDRWSPTYVIDAGGGVVALWMFERPHTDIEAAKALGLDLREQVANECCDRGWEEFDSPSPITAWLKVPGTYSMHRERLVAVISEGNRWAFADLREAVPSFERRSYRDDFYPSLERDLAAGVLPRPGPSVAHQSTWKGSRPGHNPWSRPRPNPWTRSDPRRWSP